MVVARGERAHWTFLTNHGHVLLCLARAPELRLRDVAALVGVTERAVQRIVVDLEEAGYLTRRRSGRQNAYAINADGPMRHPIEAHTTVRELIALVSDRPGRAATAMPRRTRHAKAGRAPGRTDSKR